MDTPFTYDSTNQAIFTIAQDDDNDYQESGWICFCDANLPKSKAVYYLANYSHCSCYGTWTALAGGDYSSSTPADARISASWSGSLAQLIHLAKNNLCPLMPGRVINPDDSDYDHLVAVYARILEWNQNS